MANECFEGRIRPDQRDIRDRYYEPILSRLPGTCPPDRRMLSAILSHDCALLPRDQGGEGTCGGHALAALIDIERMLALPSDADPPDAVSARMLHTMALRLDASNRREADPGVSLRDVLKGFYNYGVCLEAHWRDNDPDLRLTKCRADAARHISLGAYFRLRPNLNDYHAAISETGAVLVSAELHDGWGTLSLGASAAQRGAADAAAAKRSIRAPDFSRLPRRYVGGHAFVIVGYDEDGFVILNSWGPDWGHFRIDGQDCPGLAHWPYADWADSIMDGWVLRLGVGAAEVFPYTVGLQGLGAVAEDKVRSAPVHAVLGHYLHLDDGRFVESGPFASDEATLNETFNLLDKDAEKLARPEDPASGTSEDHRKYDGLLLTLGGALLNLDTAVAQIAQTKAALWRQRDLNGTTWYPITILWCVDYVDEARVVLEGVFEEALARIQQPGDDLDRMIENRGHGVGRAIWRDIQAAAHAALTHPDPIGGDMPGPLAHLLNRAADTHRRNCDFGLRIFAEGEGIFALEAMAVAVSQFDLMASELRGMLRSVDIVAPPIPFARFEALVRRLDRLHSPGAGAPFPIRLHLPCDADEARLAVPPYTRCFFDLVDRTFLPRDEFEDRPRATGVRAGEIGDRWLGWDISGRVTLEAIAWPRERLPAASQSTGPAGSSDGTGGWGTAPIRSPNRGAITQRELIYQSDVWGRIARSLGDATEGRPA